MELDEYQTLRLVQEKMVQKIYAHNDWLGFVNWLKSITKDNFKAFVLESIDEVLGGRDTEKTDLLEAKTLIEEV